MEGRILSIPRPLAHLYSILKEKNLFHIPSIEEVEEVHLGHTAITGLST